MTLYEVAAECKMKTEEKPAFIWSDEPDSGLNSESDFLQNENESANLKVKIKQSVDLLVKDVKPVDVRQIFVRVSQTPRDSD